MLGSRGFVLPPLPAIGVHQGRHRGHGSIHTAIVARLDSRVAVRAALAEHANTADLAGPTPTNTRFSAVAADVLRIGLVLDFHRADAHHLRRVDVDISPMCAAGTVFSMIWRTPSTHLTTSDLSSRLRSAKTAQLC
jgi:hypothetical protein